MGSGWDDVTNGNPIIDILSGQQAIAENNYQPIGG
ncbi:hypothetical protein LCGC14_2958450, partial [marine sediment metagenome]